MRQKKIDFIFENFSLMLVLSTSLVAFLWLMSIVVLLFFSTDKALVIAEVFNKSAIGFGALIAGVGGLKYLENYIENEKIKMRKEKYMSLYPTSEFDKTYDVVERKSVRGEFYIHEKNGDKVRHIGNSHTYNELGWARFGVKTLNDEEFNKFDRGDVILLSGKVGE